MAIGVAVMPAPPTLALHDGGALTSCPTRKGNGQRAGGRSFFAAQKSLHPLENGFGCPNFFAEKGGNQGELL